ncbi:MAG TPA: 3-methyl-2-oxobutanoate hydroxymethyltransferase [Rhizobacter sp.]|nr:3-methyl-2-oxobutanoate hydroxymethyltransferase [Rhizobacter sp.]
MSSHPTEAPAAGRKPVTLHRLREMQAAGEPITMLTCYDASFAKLLDSAGVDCLLVGDSLGMVIQGHQSTMPVTVEETAYHLRAVARGNRSAWLIGDMPFGSYQESTSQAMRTATALMQAGAQMVKLEGGGWTADTVRFLVDRGVPVCAHLGLTPQSVHALGGYRIQGKGDEAVATLVRHAKELSDAGAALCVLELVTAAAARAVQKEVRMATIGIGAGVECDGQVLVLHDMLGVTQGKLPRFVRNFMDGAPSVEAAITRYVADVKARRFPDDKVHAY